VPLTRLQIHVSGSLPMVSLRAPPPTRRYSQLGWLTGDRPPCVLGSAVSGKADLGRLCQLSHT
jgi:hypothetical protein